MRLLVCGSRNWMDRIAMDSWLNEIAATLEISLVIDGGQRGADQMAHEWAVRRLYETRRFFADWERYGDRAGVIRNEKMLREGKPGLVVAFPLPSSRGTWHMVGIAKAAGITTWVWPKDRNAIWTLAEGVFV